MRTSFDAAPFIERRQRLAESIGNGLAIIPGAHEVVRNHDIYYEFRQHSDFFFLTGFDEPDAVALINPWVSRSALCSSCDHGTGRWKSGTDAGQARRVRWRH